MTIRKFPERITMKKLIEYGSLDIETAEFLKKLVKSGYNIFISGGTGVTHSLSHASASGVYVARDIIKKNK